MEIQCKDDFYFLAYCDISADVALCEISVIYKKKLLLRFKLAFLTRLML